MRTKRRETIARGVYRDHGRIEIRATSDGQTFSEWLPGDLTDEEAIRKRAQLLARVETDHPRPSPHTIADDARRYLRLIGDLHPTTRRSRKAHLETWAERFPKVPRHRLTERDIRAARAAWLSDLSPKTINHMVQTLRHLYRLLDGKGVRTPCDDLEPLPVPRTPIVRVSPAVMQTVHRNLWNFAHRTIYHRSKEADLRAVALQMHARFCVLVSTGKRPSEVGRAQPEDVNLEARVWAVRDGKGGISDGLYLNEDRLQAWRYFIACRAWGPFNTSLYAKYVHRAGWPAAVRPYNARHSLLTWLLELGFDHQDVANHAGHTNVRTTLRYTGVLGGRQQRMAESLEGLFQGFNVGATVGETGK